jgi:hypothetical protein
MQSPAHKSTAKNFLWDLCDQSAWQACGFIFFGTTERQKGLVVYMAMESFFIFFFSKVENKNHKKL